MSGAREIFDGLTADAFSAVTPETEWMTSLSILSEVCVGLDDPTRADALYSLLLPYAKLNVFNHPEVSRGSVSRYLGLLAGATGRPVEAGEHFEHALALNRTMGALPWLAWTQRDYAQMLLAGGDPGGRAAGLLDAAKATAYDLGMVRLLGEITAA
jgi:hypothetical protein